MLPTPAARDGAPRSSQHPDKRRAGGHQVGLDDLVEHLLPTPTARDWKDGAPVDGVPINGLLGRQVWGLLPTPTATPYGSNQSPSPGAAVRPSLDTLAPSLLPTPTATDSSGSRGHRRDGTPYGPTSGMTLTDATETLLPTPRATDGSKGGPNQRGSSGDLMLPSAVQLLIEGD
jgi:hypothetical protein